MRFEVNIYIHIYNHPMYIIKNHDKPMKNLQLSYHDGVIFLDLINLFLFFFIKQINFKKGTLQQYKISR